MGCPGARIAGFGANKMTPTSNPHGYSTIFTTTVYMFGLAITIAWVAFLGWCAAGVGRMVGW